MQIVCEKCGQTGAAASIDVRAGVVFVRCGRCGAESALAGTPIASTSSGPRPPVALVPTPEPLRRTPLASAPLVDVELVAESGGSAPIAEVVLPPIKCPKCGHRQNDPEACDRCGLVFANVRDGRKPWEEWPAEQRPYVSRAEALWNDVAQRPDDPAYHAAFVDYCRQHGLVALAATRYRHRLADHPGDAVSRSYLERIIRDAAAMAQAMSTPVQRSADAIKRVKNGVLVAVLVISAIATIVLVRMTMSALRGVP